MAALVGSAAPIPDIDPMDDVGLGGASIDALPDDGATVG
jgi:hypothetical protein